MEWIKLMLKSFLLPWAKSKAEATQTPVDDLLVAAGEVLIDSPQFMAAVQKCLDNGVPASQIVAQMSGMLGLK